MLLLLSFQVVGTFGQCRTGQKRYTIRRKDQNDKFLGSEHSELPSSCVRFGPDNRGLSEDSDSQSSVDRVTSSERYPSTLHCQSSLRTYSRHRGSSQT